MRSVCSVFWKEKSDEICRYAIGGILRDGDQDQFFKRRRDTGYYGQIWFNRDYTYECAIEEMPAGYADGLMAASPMWSLIVVIIAGVVLSVVVSKIATKVFKLEK